MQRFRRYDGARIRRLAFPGRKSRGAARTPPRATGWCWRCGHGFVVATGMDPCAVDSVRGVLAGVCVQAQEDEAARELEPALPLRAAAAGRGLTVVSARGPLWAAGRSFRSSAASPRAP